jgi:hypothetical protein
MCSIGTARSTNSPSPRSTTALELANAEQFCTDCREMRDNVFSQQVWMQRMRAGDGQRFVPPIR